MFRPAIVMTPKYEHRSDVYYFRFGGWGDTARRRAHCLILFPLEFASLGWKGSLTVARSKRTVGAVSSGYPFELERKGRRQWRANFKALRASSNRLSGRFAPDRRAISRPRAKRGHYCYRLR